MSRLAGNQHITSSEFVVQVKFRFGLKCIVFGGQARKLNIHPLCFNLSYYLGPSIEDV